jgi:type IV pilus assembly protein PilE
MPSTAMRQNTAVPGFTLVELLVAVAIVGIMASLAYPNYTEHVRATRRADAQGALYTLQQAMERFFTANSTYEGSADAAGAPVGGLGHSATVPTGGGTPTYNLRITDITATSYTLRAEPVNAQAADKCQILTLTSTSVRGIAGTKPSLNLAVTDCWRN